MPVRLILIRFRRRLLSYSQIIREVLRGVYWTNKLITMGQVAGRKR